MSGGYFFNVIGKKKTAFVSGQIKLMMHLLRCAGTTSCISLRRCRPGFLGARGLYYLPGLQARGADLYPFRDSVYQRPDSLQVRVPPPFSQVMGVGYIMSKGRFLAANLTCFCHIGSRFLISSLLLPI